MKLQEYQCYGGEALYHVVCVPLRAEVFVAQEALPEEQKTFYLFVCCSIQNKKHNNVLSNGPAWRWYVVAVVNVIVIRVGCVLLVHAHTITTGTAQSMLSLSCSFGHLCSTYSVTTVGDHEYIT